MEIPERAARRGLVAIQPKTPTRGEGLSRSPAHGGNYPLVVNGWQTESVQSPGYVGQSEDRLCEPPFQRSTAHSGVRVYAQDHLGAGILPTPQPKQG